MRGFPLFSSREGDLMTNTITEAAKEALRKEGAAAERERVRLELSKVRLYIAEESALLNFGKKYISAYAMKDIKRILTLEPRQ
jgi:hypothetical protein